MINHAWSDLVLQTAFSRWHRSGGSLALDPRKSLSEQVAESLKDGGHTIPHLRVALFASASVEMWHRAIHSFLWSVALKDHSPIWSSVSGYYASHYVMRAFAHAFGFFKSFSHKKVIQVVIEHGAYVCSVLDEKDRGEHNFYWKVVKSHPRFIDNQLFRYNSDRDKTADCSHRNLASYADHIDDFRNIGFPTDASLTGSIERISRIRRFSVTGVHRENFPDLDNVHILAYQRIVTFQEFLDARLRDNRFWKMHRSPTWSLGITNIPIEEASLKGMQEAIG